MKKAVLLFAAAVAALAQHDFDFKALDKLGANATSSTNVTLDANMLKLAGNFLDSGDTDLKSVVKNLKGVYVRSYEFDKAGQYKESDLAPVRDYIRKLQWPKIVDVKEADETTEIYLQPLP
ncbi:MAG TPA: DUF4252 domain-containing protein, partial [Bryobacteraceae bacterium]|nr:DUF4252 domain-containing protein [Bryobacteraceae bacterium]